MKKKIGEIIIVIVSILLVIFGIFYLIDLNRMKNNKPILFSTWGKKYQEPYINSLTNYEIVDSLENSYYFYGKVVESKSNYIIVEPNEGEEIRKSADKISIGLGEYNDELYVVGTNVKITYSGYVMETYPAKVEASKIELKSAQNFELE